VADAATAREVALAFLQGFWDSDVDGAMSYCAPGATWQFARSLPYARECEVREALQAIVDDMFQSFDPEGFSIEIHHVVSQDDQVMVEYSAHGATRDGRPYDNDYVMCITVSNGKVSSVRPHTDTLHLTHLLMAETVAEA
jgi:ketosteroid isomerase-like protein